MSPFARQGRGVGFTLIETVVALAVLSTALLFTIALVGQESGATRRLMAHGEALRAIEATLEGVRAGLIVPVDGSVLEPEAWLLSEEPMAESLRIHVQVVPLSPPRLVEVQLRARYAVRGRWFERTLETRSWSPP